MNITSQLERYFPLAESYASLLFPLVEVVIHDLASEQIVAIYNSFSGRKVGDESLLEKGHNFTKGPHIIGPYLKSEAKSPVTKSITSVLRGKNGKAIGLLCVNVDIKHLQPVRSFLDNFLSVNEKSADTEGLFVDDGGDKINIFVQNYLRRLKISPQAMASEVRLEVISALKKEGAFATKNAAHFVANALGISRASVYNHLAQIKEEK